MKKPKYGYAAITADFMHIGHIKFLKSCKERCQNLIVGVMTDKCVAEYKGKEPVMNYKQRVEMVRCLKMIYKTVPQKTFKFPAWLLKMKEQHGKDLVIFDSKQHCRDNADSLVDYTEGISSTMFKRMTIDTHNSQ